jgi:hypothetical protein
MDKLKFFKTLQLLVKANYVSTWYVFKSETENEMLFETTVDSLLYKVSRNGDHIDVFHGNHKLAIEEGYLENFVVFAAGYITNISSAEKLLNSPTYVGCDLGCIYGVYYFKKYNKTYKLIINKRGCIVKVIDEETGEITICEFDDFVNIILYTTNTKSARN